MVFILATTDGNTARRDFLNYALSLMRSHNDEHSDSLPILDISAMRHVAYVFDSLIYYMRSGTDTETDVFRDGISVISWDHDENDNDEHDDDPVTNSLSMETESVDGESDIAGKSGRKHQFFHRSDSTTFLGCPPPDPFQTPLVEALPLADKPHLLQPNARREDMFGMVRQTVIPVPTCEESKPSSTSQFDKFPIRMALTGRVQDSMVPSPASESVTPNDSSAQNQQNLPDVTFNGASVIVKPSSQPVPNTAQSSEPSDATVAAVFGGTTSSSLGSSDTINRHLETSNVASELPEPSTSGELATNVGENLKSFEERESLSNVVEQKVEVQQASVIVHASTAQGSTIVTTSVVQPRKLVDPTSSSSVDTSTAQNKDSDDKIEENKDQAMDVTECQSSYESEGQSSREKKSEESSIESSPSKLSSSGSKTTGSMNSDPSSVLGRYVYIYPLLRGII